MVHLECAARDDVSVFRIRAFWRARRPAAESAVASAFSRATAYIMQPDTFAARASLFARARRKSVCIGLLRVFLRAIRSDVRQEIFKEERAEAGELDLRLIFLAESSRMCRMKKIFFFSIFYM